MVYTVCNDTAWLFNCTRLLLDSSITFGVDYMYIPRRFRSRSKTAGLMQEFPSRRVTCTYSENFCCPPRSRILVIVCASSTESENFDVFNGVYTTTTVAYVLIAPEIYFRSYPINYNIMCLSRYHLLLMNETHSQCTP